MMIPTSHSPSPNSSPITKAELLCPPNLVLTAEALQELLSPYSVQLRRIRIIQAIRYEQALEKLDWEAAIVQRKTLENSDGFPLEGADDDVLEVSEWEMSSEECMDLLDQAADSLLDLLTLD